VSIYKIPLDPKGITAYDPFWIMGLSQLRKYPDFPEKGSKMSINTRLCSKAGEREYFLGTSDRRIIWDDDEPGPLQLWRDMRAKVEREDLPPGVSTKDATGRMPTSWRVVAVCYATAAILLGWWPWNFLLLLLLFGSSKHLRYGGFDKAPARDLVPGTRSWR
jgi:hypothetical protein